MTTKETQTPEADKAAYEATARTIGKYIVPLDKARKMERERDEARAEATRWQSIAEGRERDDVQGLLIESLAMAEAWEDFDGAPAADFVKRLRSAIYSENINHINQP